MWVPVEQQMSNCGRCKVNLPAKGRGWYKHTHPTVLAQTMRDEGDFFAIQKYKACRRKRDKEDFSSNRTYHEVC